MDRYLSPKKAPTARAQSKDARGKKLPSASDSTIDESHDTTHDLETTDTRNPTQSSTQPLKRKRTEDAAPTPKTSLTFSRTTSSDKKPRRSKGYAPPSTYEHLPALPDTITPNLICLFVGLNPGIQTATKGHPYAHPSNLYWRLLHSSGLTPDRRLAPAEYITLPERYLLGNTNIVGRATRDGAQLSKDEMVAGARVLDEKVRKWRPEVVCLVGKSIWEAVWKWKHGRAIKPKEFKYGFQDPGENMGRSGGLGGSGSTGEGVAAAAEGAANGSSEAWSGAKVFVATTTSGLAASMSLQEKEAIWAQLGTWVNERRKERKQVEIAKHDTADIAAVAEEEVVEEEKQIQEKVKE